MQGMEDCEDSHSVGFSDLDGDDLAGEGGRSVEDDDLVVGGASGELDPAGGGGDGWGDEGVAVAVDGGRG